MLKRPPPSHGVSLVELMIGIAIGLFIVAASSVMMTNQIGNTRKLLLETQVEQELRSAADMITRDVRRAGYWENSLAIVGANGTQADPYAGVTVDPVTRTIRFDVAADADNAVDPTTEQRGYRLANGRIEMLLGGVWQALTDPAVVTVTAFAPVLNVQQVGLTDYCPTDCTGGMACNPRQAIREVILDIQGQAAADANVQRQLRTRVRLRNDEVLGQCT